MWLRCAPGPRRKARAVSRPSWSRISSASAVVPARLRSNWVKAAEEALTRNASTFAVLSLEYVAGRDNYLDTMRAKGYEVIAP